MKHLFAHSSLSVTGNPLNHPTAEELALPDGETSIAELLDETKNKEDAAEAAEAKGKDDSRESNGETLS